MKIFVYTEQDNKAIIVLPAAALFNAESPERKDLEKRGIAFNSDDELYEYIARQSIPKGVNYIVAESTILPDDRYFRDAWDLVAKDVTVNMQKAQDIHMTAIRKWRDTELKKLDVPAIRAIEAEDKTTLAEISAKKQELRDIPQTINLKVAKTPAELKNILPDGMLL